MADERRVRLQTRSAIRRCGCRYHLVKLQTSQVELCVIGVLVVVNIMVRDDITTELQ